MSVIAVFNQKGGVGKTTTALNLLAALARAGRSPWAIDLDPQAQLTAISGIRERSGDDTLLALFQHNHPVRQLLRETETGLRLIPSHTEAVASTKATLNKSASGMKRKAHGAQKPGKPVSAQTTLQVMS